MVYQVLREDISSCVVVATFGTRPMAERFVAKQKAPKRRKLSIREVTIRMDSPSLNYPYLPGIGR